MSPRVISSTILQRMKLRKMCLVPFNPAPNKGGLYTEVLCALLCAAHYCEVQSPAHVSLVLVLQGHECDIGLPRVVETLVNAPVTSVNLKAGQVCQPWDSHGHIAVGLSHSHGTTVPGRAAGEAARLADNACR